MKKAIYYHAGCPACRSAEDELVSSLDTSKLSVEVVNLGEQPARIDEAEAAGVKTLPALVIEGKPFHINFGASLEEIKAQTGATAGVRTKDDQSWDISDDVED